MVQARNLTADGQVDPFVELSLFDPATAEVKKQWSATWNNEPNPKWGEKFDFVNISATSLLTVTVWDKKGMLESVRKKRERSSGGGVFSKYRERRKREKKKWSFFSLFLFPNPFPQPKQQQKQQVTTAVKNFSVKRSMTEKIGVLRLRVDEIARNRRIKDEWALQETQKGDITLQLEWWPVALDDNEAAAAGEEGKKAAAVAAPATASAAGLAGL